MTTPAPSPENGYTVDATMDMTAGLFNGIFGSIHDRLVAREQLEGDFEALIAQGTSAALALVQENVAPQLAALQEQIQEAAAAVNEIIDNGAAPNSLLLGGQLPAYYLDPANFAAEAFIKEFLVAGTASAARTAIGARSETQVNNAISTAIAALVNGSPEVLDTLQELAAALGNDANFATTVTTALAGKVAKAGDTMTGGLGLPFAEFINAAAPANPAAGKTRAYVKTDGKLAYRDSAGVEVVLGEVIFASQAEAEAGSDNTKAMSALRVEQHMLANAIGHNQSWQTPSRSVGTSYQNTTGRPIAVALSPNGTSAAGVLEVSPDNTNWTGIQLILGSSSDQRQAFAIVPTGHYYRLTAGSFSIWRELR